MNNERTLYVLMGAGVLLIVLSFIVPKLLAGRSAWTEQDAMAYSEAAADLHGAIHAQAHDHGPNRSQGELPHDSLEVAKKKFAERKAKLEAAQRRGRLSGQLLLALGVVCSGAGIVTFFVKRMDRAA